MKLSKNFYCIAEVVCEHWYLGSSFSDITIELEEEDWELEEKSEFYQKIADSVLNYVDKRHMYEDYRIKLRFMYEEITEFYLSEQFIQNWKDKYYNC